MTATDKDGYPTLCCMCGHRIVKAHGVPLQFHYDHATGEARSWHVRCGSPLETLMYPVCCVQCPHSLKYSVHFGRLHGSGRQKGTRPDFSKAARPEVAEPLYERFCQALRDLGVHVETGVFRAHMQVELVNDGPVTIVLDIEPAS